MRYAVTLAGGGMKGSFQVGVLKRLVEVYGYPEMISGSSVGALNGAMVASGQIREMEDFWLSLNSSNTLFPDYMFGLAQGIYRRSFRDNRRLIEAINKLIDWDKLINGKFFIGTYTDVQSGDSVTFTNRNIDENTFKRSLLASASIQPIFPAVLVKNVWAGDGGYRNVVPVKELTQTKNYSNIDKHFIITAGTINTEYYNYKHGSLFKDFLRVIDLLCNEVLQNDLQKGSSYYWTNDKYFLIEPKINLIDTLESNPQKIRQNIDYGYTLGGHLGKWI